MCRNCISGQTRRATNAYLLPTYLLAIYSDVVFTWALVFFFKRFYIWFENCILTKVKFRASRFRKRKILSPLRRLVQILSKLNRRSLALKKYHLVASKGLRFIVANLFFSKLASFPLDFFCSLNFCLAKTEMKIKLIGADVR